ncbi:hypothetical protein FB379_1671 [Aeribacillus composti]|nr:hypothetical protein FB379_1671 [Aeribacillus composti]
MTRTEYENKIKELGIDLEELNIVSLITIFCDVHTIPEIS